jgi:hypothetical protein
MRKVSPLCLIVLIVLFEAATCAYQAAPYADWAHDHLVWIDAKDQSES